MNIFLSFKNTFLLFNAYFTSFLAYWAYKTPVPTPIKQNGNAILCTYMCTYTYCTYMHIHAHICTHLEASSSRCICPFLMRVFKSRHRPLFCPFANQQLNRAQFSLRKMVKDTARFEVQISVFGFVSSWQSPGKSDFIFELLERRECQIYSWVLFSNMPHPMHTLHSGETRQAKLSPPALIYALNNAKLHNECNQKCISAFSSLDFRPRKHWYLSDFLTSTSKFIFFRKEIYLQARNLLKDQEWNW